MTLHPTITHWRTLKRYSTIEKELKELHNNFYNYANSVYKSSKEYITIICPIHGPFEQTPSHHLKGIGCPKCGTERTSIAQRSTTKKFIESAVNKLGQKYDYSKVTYVDRKTEVIIVCKIHGPFKQSPRDHLSGCPCPECSKRVIKTTESFIKEAEEKHNNLYTYANAVYIKDLKKLEITCTIHGSFWQSPNNHLKGAGCPDCGGSKLKSKNKFIEDAIKVHGNKYNYTNSTYNKDRFPITIECPIHGPFTQKANSHLRGVGCSSCAVSGFKPNQPAILYYLSIKNGRAYKIGITNRTIQQRFQSDMEHITIMYQIHYKNGQDAYTEEQRILKQYKEFKYTGPNLLKSGNTELFIKDILNE